MKTWTTSGNYKIIRVLSGWSNAFLLKNGKSTILIDTGPQFMWKTLQKRLKKLRIEHIDLLILTHSHYDHAANAHKIREKYNVRVIIHESEAKYLAAGDNIPPKGTTPLINFMVRAFTGLFSASAGYQPCEPDYTMDNNYELSNEGFNAYLMHTPGHTMGSLSLIIDNEIALVGDAMFGIFLWSILPPFASDKDQMINSWKKLLDANWKIFIPSHGTENKRSLVEKDYNKRKTAL